MPPADPSSDHADAGRDMSRALGGRLPPPSAAWAGLAPAEGQERLRSMEDRWLWLPGLLRWPPTGEREPSRAARCWEEVDEDGEGEAIRAFPFLVVDKFVVSYVG